MTMKEGILKSHERMILLKKAVLLLLCTPLLVACSHTIIDWADFVKVDGKEYHAVYNGVLADKVHIGKEVEQVKFKISGNITRTNYKAKNGDAAFWEKGTKIFTVKDMPAFVMIRDDDEINGYRLYQQHASDYLWMYSKINKEEIQRIELYKGYQNPDLIQEITDEQEIAELMDTLDRSKEQPAFTPNTSQDDPTLYHMVFYNDKPIAHKYELFFDGLDWYWYPDDIAVLPANQMEKLIE